MLEMYKEPAGVINRYACIEIYISSAVLAFHQNILVIYNGFHQQHIGVNEADMQKVSKTMPYGQKQIFPYSTQLL